MSNAAINASKIGEKPSKTWSHIKFGKLASSASDTQDTSRAAINKSEADEFAEQMRTIVFKIAMQDFILSPWGKTYAHLLAQRLNEAGIKSRTGGAWHPTTARRLLDRLGSDFRAQVIAARAAEHAAENRTLEADIHAALKGK